MTEAGFPALHIPENEDRTPLASGLALCAWYRAGHRDLPWRHTTDPYRILVSEIMLQQTRVETVIGYYHRFIEAFPDVRSLAEAPEERVMALWQGLGYYSRARNLQAAAKAVLSRHDGRFPAGADALLALPGIGAYTAGAVLSIAFGIPTPAVDGNVLRVVSRLQLIEEDILEAKTRKRVSDAIVRMIPQTMASDFCQGMMELGATLCTPTSPRCGDCPLGAFCQARRAGRQSALPVRKSKTRVVESQQAVLVIRDNLGRLLLVWREAGLLAGMWGLPHVESESETPDGDDLQAMWENQSGLRLPGRLVVREFAGQYRHVFTHRVWHVRVWLVDLLKEQETPCETNGYKWLDKKDLADIPIPEAFRKALRTAGVDRRQSTRGSGRKSVKS